MSKKAVFSLLILLVLLGSMAYVLYQNKQVLDEAKAPKEMNLTVPVNIYTASYGSVGDSISKVGTLKPIEEGKVFSEGNGRIEQIMFKEGSYVKAGQTLATLDSDMQAAQLAAAKSAYDKAEKDYQRLAGLLEKGSVNESQVEQALLGYQNAEAQYKIAKKQLENMKISAGISGIITKKHVVPGAFVGVGTPVADIVNTSTLELEIKLSEQDVSKIKEDQTVNVTTELYPLEVFSGRVTYIAPAADKDRMFPIKISLPNMVGEELRAGMFATAGFKWEGNRDLIMIPSKAVGGTASEPFVFLEKGNKAEKRMIQTAGVYGEMTALSGGLEPGEKVITTSITNLEEGSTVEVLEETNPTEAVSYGSKSVSEADNSEVAK